MYTKEKLEAIVKKSKELGKETERLNSTLISDLFVLNEELSFSLIQNNVYQEKLDYSFYFSHNSLDNIYINVKINLKNFLEDEKIEPSFSFFTKVDSQFINKEISELSLSLDKTIELIDFFKEVALIFKSLDKEIIKNRVLTLKSVISKKNKQSRLRMRYNNLLNLQENRNNYKQYYNLLTKKRTKEEFEEYIKKHEDFSYVTLEFSKDLMKFKLNKITHNKYNIIFLNQNTSNINIIERHFFDDCIFQENKFINSLEEIIKLFNLDSLEQASLNKDEITMPKEFFFQYFNKYLITNKVSNF